MKMAQVSTSRHCTKSKFISPLKKRDEEEEVAMSPPSSPPPHHNRISRECTKLGDDYEDNINGRIIFPVGDEEGYKQLLIIKRVQPSCAVHFGTQCEKLAMLLIQHEHVWREGGSITPKDKGKIVCRDYFPLDEARQLISVSLLLLLLYRKCIYFAFVFRNFVMAA